MATRTHKKDDGKIKGQDQTNHDPDDQNHNNETENNDRNTSAEDQTEQNASTKKLKVKKWKGDSSDIEGNRLSNEEQWNSLDGLFNRVERVRSLLNMSEKDINSKFKNGKYKYSKFLREKYKKLSRTTKGIEAAANVVSGLGKAVSGGYSEGWGMR